MSSVRIAKSIRHQPIKLAYLDPEIELSSPSNQVVTERKKKCKSFAVTNTANIQTVYSFNPGSYPIYQTESLLTIKWTKTIVSFIGLTISTIAVIYFGAEVNQFKPESWFWSGLIVCSSTILLAIKFRPRSGLSWVHKIVGVSVLAIGYLGMHTSISQNKQHQIEDLMRKDTEINLVKSSIRDIEDRLHPTRSAIKQLHPIKMRTTISRLQEISLPLETELEAKRNQLIAAEKKVRRQLEADLAERWSLVEWLRRLILEPLNILCTHSFFQEFQIIAAALRRRTFRLTGAMLV